MSVDLEVWVKPVKVDGIEDRFMVCEATFNYVPSTVKANHVQYKAKLS